MTDYPQINLKPGRDSSARFGHPWIFSGALPGETNIEHGAIVRVGDSAGQTLGVGTYSKKSSIAVRLFDFADITLDEPWFVERLRDGDERRRLMGLGPKLAADGYRVVFGEADGLPGLIIDRYRDTFVLQISTAGTERLKPTIVAALKTVFQPKNIVERSDLTVRKEEGLEQIKEVLMGDASELVEFSEDGRTFLADVLGGQKTGFYLDQRDSRRQIAKLSAGREGINLFSYTGSTGIVAMGGGAKSILNIDSSASALEGCRKHAQLNGVAVGQFATEEADVFQYLAAHTEPTYSLVMLDPPALIKNNRDTEEGKKAYHFLNRGALRLAKDGSLFVTSSCSHFLSEEDFAFILRRASLQAGVRLDVLAAVRQSADHPISVYFPESAYLKSFICRVKRLKS